MHSHSSATPNKVYHNAPFLTVMVLNTSGTLKTSLPETNIDIIFFILNRTEDVEMTSPLSYTETSNTRNREL